MEGLEIWHLAGADLNKPSYDGRTASQVVGSTGRCIPLKEQILIVRISSYS